MSTSQLARDPLPLQGKTVLITGVSRRAGIGYATACRAAAWGANVFCHHFSPHDDLQPWGGDDIGAVLDGVRQHLVGSARVEDFHADLADHQAPAQVMAAARTEFGQVDGLVCNQAVSGSDGALSTITARDLDHHWAVNARASLLLTQAFAAQDAPGAVVFMTSGQGQGPMPQEVAYATSKAAVAGITTTLAHELAPAGIRINTVNPGPVDTGYLEPGAKNQLMPMFPFGRWGEPDDPARLITWLLTEEAAWITGQVINSEGGFTR